MSAPSKQPEHRRAEPTIIWPPNPTLPPNAIQGGGSRNVRFGNLPARDFIGSSYYASRHGRARNATNPVAPQFDPRSRYTRYPIPPRRLPITDAAVVEPARHRNPPAAVPDPNHASPPIVGGVREPSFPRSRASPPPPGRSVMPEPPWSDGQPLDSRRRSSFNYDGLHDNYESYGRHRPAPYYDGPYPRGYGSDSADSNDSYGGYAYDYPHHSHRHYIPYGRQYPPGYLSQEAGETEDPGSPYQASLAYSMGRKYLGSKWADTFQRKAEPLSAYIFAFFTDLIPRQVYILLLLYVPNLYWSRVSKVFTNARDSHKIIIELVMENHIAIQDLSRVRPHVMHDKSSPLNALRLSWGYFIDSVLREWETFNIVSALLLPAILTILQIDAAAADPLTRFSAYASLICALMSLLYGGIYIISFGRMKATYKAALWAHYVRQQAKTAIAWNVWVLLAMPAVWLAWSLVAFIVCVMAFLWRTGTNTEVELPGISFSTALAPRIVISSLLAVGLLYLLLMLDTFRHWGDKMDRAWRDHLNDCCDAQKAPYSKTEPVSPYIPGGRKSRRSANIFDSFGPKPGTYPGPYGYDFAPPGVFVPSQPAPDPPYPPAPAPPPPPAPAPPPSPASDSSSPPASDSSPSASDPPPRIIREPSGYHPSYTAFSNYASTRTRHRSHNTRESGHRPSYLRRYSSHTQY